MCILGIGVDVVHVPRIAALLSRYPQRLASRILSPQEAVQSDMLADPTFIAVRYDGLANTTGQRLLYSLDGQ